ALEVILIVQEVEGDPNLNAGEQPTILAPPAYRNTKVGNILQLILKSQIFVQRNYHTAIYSVLDQCLGQSTCHISQSTAFGERGRFAGRIQNIHSQSSFTNKWAQERYCPCAPKAVSPSC